MLNKKKYLIIEFFKLIKPHILLAIIALIFLSIAASTILIIGLCIRMVIDELIIGTILPDIITLTTLGLILSSIIISISSFGRFVAISFLEENIAIDLKKKLFKKILTLSIKNNKFYSYAEILILFQEDITKIKEGVGRSLSIGIRSLIQLIGSLILLLFTNINLFLSVLLLTSSVLIPIYILGKNLKKKTRRKKDFNIQIFSFIEESCSQLLTIKLWGEEKNHINKLSKKLKTENILTKQQILSRAFLISSVILLISSALSILFWIGGQSVLTKSMSGGELVSFIFYSIIAAGSINTLNEIITTIYQSLNSLEKIITTPPKKQKYFLLKNNIQKNKILNIVELNNVNYRYKKQIKNTLKNINLHIKKGTFTAIIGPSGSGKSTLINLILGIIQTKIGTITIQGQNISNIDLPKLWNIIGYIPQQPNLFNLSIIENINYGSKNEKIELIKTVSNQTNSNNFIKKLAQGYNNYVGINGNNLSLGQKQRIFLSRILLRNPKLLILDEPTSALDIENEQYISKILIKNKTKSTILMITHRLSIIKNADQILLINQHGEIEIRGSHNQLLKNNILYKKLVQDRNKKI